MKVTYSEPNEKSNKSRNKRKNKKRRLFFVIWLLVISALILGILSVTVWFNIKGFALSGSSVYSREQIISVAGINLGDNLLLTSSSKAEKRIESELPYIKKAMVSKAFPNKLNIQITPADEYFNINTNDEMFITDRDFKVLRCVNAKPENLKTVIGLAVTQTKPGAVITFEDNSQKDKLAELMGLCEEKQINVTYIDITSLVDIKFAVNNNIFVELGSYADMVYKIEHLSKMIDDIDKYATASISLAGWTVERKNAVLKYEDISKYMQ